MPAMQLTGGADLMSLVGRWSLLFLSSWGVTCPSYALFGRAFPTQLFLKSLLEVSKAYFRIDSTRESEF